MFERKSLTSEYFISSDPRELQAKLLNTVTQRMGYDAEPSDPAYLVACCALPPLSQCLAKIDLGVKQKLTQFATGRALEAIAEDLGLERKTPRTAKFRFKITGMQSFINPFEYTASGTINSKDGDIIGKWSAEGVITSSDIVGGNIARIVVESDTQEELPVTTIAVCDSYEDTSTTSRDASSCVFDGIVDTGSNDETDDELAIRCHNTRVGLMYVGSLRWYKAICVNAGYPVVDISYNGMVNDRPSISILLLGEDCDNTSASASQALRTEVENYILQNLLMPGDNLSFTPPVKATGPAPAFNTGYVVIRVLIPEDDATTRAACTEIFERWRMTGCDRFGFPDVLGAVRQINESCPGVSMVSTVTNVNSMASNACFTKDMISLNIVSVW